MSTGTPPLVSIALCTYNGERYLAEQLDSLLAQRHRPLELVACDDGSTDGTWGILQRFAPRFEQARLLRNPTTLGVHANFRQALSACRGDWVAPCDQDDIWAPDKLSRMLQSAGDALLVYCDSQLIDAHGHPLGERVSARLPMIEGSQPLAFAFGNCVSGHATLLRRSLLRRAMPMPHGVFYDWWLAFVAASSGTIRYLDEPLVQFRQHDTNLTGFIGQGDGQRKSPRHIHEVHMVNLAALAEFPGSHQTLLSKLATQWRQRERQWISPHLMALMWRHHQALTLLEPRAHRRPAWRYALKFFWGLRTKMLVWQLRRRGRQARNKVYC